MIQRRYRDKNGKLIIVNVPDYTERLDLGAIFGYSTSQGGPSSINNITGSIDQIAINWEDITQNWETIKP